MGGFNVLDVMSTMSKKAKMKLKEEIKMEKEKKKNEKMI
jgi:hypothetical protein